MDAASYVDRNRAVILEDWRRLIRDRANDTFTSAIGEAHAATEFDEVLSGLVGVLRTPTVEAQQREREKIVTVAAAMAQRWMERGVAFEDAYRGMAAIRWAVWNAVQRGVFDLGVLTLKDLVNVGRLLNRLVDTMLMQAGVIYVGSAEAPAPPVEAGPGDLADLERALGEALRIVRRMREHG